MLLLEGLRLDVADAVATIELLEGKKVAVLATAAAVKLVATVSRSTTETVDNSLSGLCCCRGSSL